MPSETENTVPTSFLAGSTWTMGSAIYFGIIFAVTTYSYRWNVVFGLFCSLILALVGIILIAFGYEVIRESTLLSTEEGSPWLLKFMEERFKISMPQTALAKQFQISYFGPIVTYFLASWSSLAYGFARLRPSAYAHPERLSYWLMCKHYLWQLVDMVPLVEAWKHIHVEDPILETRLWPGVLVLMFRLVILLVVVTTAAKLFGFKKREK